MGRALDWALALSALSGTANLGATIWPGRLNPLSEVYESGRRVDEAHDAVSDRANLSALAMPIAEGQLEPGAA